MPQPVRYKFELELGLALVVAFAGRALLRRFPISVRRAAIFVLLALAAEQVAAYRKLEKSYQFPRDVTQTVEYQASTWTARNLPGVRVFFPGSIAQWANAFTDVPQFTGGSWSMATNQSQQNADAAILFETGALDAGAKLSLTWLKAYGVGAIAVAGPNSEEYWKPFSDPTKFDSLPALWSARGVTIRGVPARSRRWRMWSRNRPYRNIGPGFPRISPKPRTMSPQSKTRRFPCQFSNGKGRERMRIRANLSPGQVISVQEGYHPGWRALVGGRKREVFKDGLGLMWLRPECTGACEIALEYNGGWEWWICHAISFAAIVGLMIALFWRRVR